MTQAEINLIVKDLVGRLPYGTIYDIKIGGVTYVKISLNSFYYSLIEKNFNNGRLESIVPYLKKMTYHLNIKVVI